MRLENKDGGRDGAESDGNLTLGLEFFGVTRSHGGDRLALCAFLPSALGESSTSERVLRVLSGGDSHPSALASSDRQHHCWYSR